MSLLAGVVLAGTALAVVAVSGTWRSDACIEAAATAGVSENFLIGGRASEQRDLLPFQTRCTWEIPQGPTRSVVVRSETGTTAVLTALVFAAGVFLLLGLGMSLWRLAALLWPS